MAKRYNGHDWFRSHSILRTESRQTNAAPSAPHTSGPLTHAPLSVRKHRDARLLCSDLPPLASAVVQALLNKVYERSSPCPLSQRTIIPHALTDFLKTDRSDRTPATAMRRLRWKEPEPLVEPPAENSKAKAYQANVSPQAPTLLGQSKLLTPQSRPDEAVAPLVACANRDLPR